MVQETLYSSLILTPLGSMIALATDQSLYFLEFVDHPHLKQKIKKLQQALKAKILEGYPSTTALIEKELYQYFKGSLKKFETPFSILGSPFQKKVWEELQKIPLGQTRSYSNLATAIERPSAFRAVARANSTNPLPILIPCHRVIHANGTLGGYSSGIFRKKWLLELEQHHQ